VAARLFRDKRARIVAVSDSRGGIMAGNDDSLDPQQVIAHKAREGTVVGLPAAAASPTRTCSGWSAIFLCMPPSAGRCTAGTRQPSAPA
jgi:hypothetical protein